MAIDGKKLKDALAKAKNVGLVEEAFTIEDCELVLRNLRQDEYNSILQDCDGLDGMAYLNAYQRGHIARSIVSLNGVDLRDTAFVEVDEDDPKRPGQTKTVKHELHAYLNKQVLGTWGKEAIFTAFRKFGDVVGAAEIKAKQGVTFVLSDERDEDKYRRLLLEAQECEEAMPQSMVTSILDELGLMRKSTADEIKAAMTKTDELARAQAAADQAAADQAAADQAAAAAEAAIQQASADQASAAAEAAIQQAAADQAAADQARPSAGRPMDPHLTLQQVIASRTPVPVVAAQASQDTSPALKRGAEIAALEGAADSHGLIEVYRPDQPQGPVEVRKREPFDASGLATILDKPPSAGINPRFKPQPKI